MDDCIFCKIIKKEIPAEIICESENAIAFKDINPVAPHHYLVIPKRHVESLAHAEAADMVAVTELIQEVVKKFNLKGFRTIFNSGAEAGQTVFHMHAHVIAGKTMNWPHL